MEFSTNRRTQVERLRRTLKRRGMFLTKTSRRDVLALDFDTFTISKSSGGRVFPAAGKLASLAEVTAWVDSQ